MHLCHDDVDDDLREYHHSFWWPAVFYDKEVMKEKMIRCFIWWLAHSEQRQHGEPVPSDFTHIYVLLHQLWHQS